MAPRKAAKHADTEVVDKAAEAGDVSPPKRKKITTKTAHENVEEKQIRLPRAAKLNRIVQPEISDTTEIKSEKVKNKTSASKDISVSSKTTSKVKSTAKKSKDEEIANKNSSITEDTKKPEETESKKKRTKAAAKMAGMDAATETKTKSDGRTKRHIVNKSSKILDVPMAKTRKQANDEVALTEDKSKIKLTKKKETKIVNAKSKINNKKKNANNNNNNEIENEDNIVEKSDLIPKDIKKLNDNKEIKSTRITRGRKNESSTKNSLNNSEQSKEIETVSKLIHIHDNEKVDQPNQPEVSTLVQTTRNGKSVKKEKQIVQSKKVNKTRGKTNHNIDAVTNEDDTNTLKSVKDLQIEISKESTPSTATLKKGRGKRGTATTVKDEPKKNMENATTEAKIDSSNISISNNNIQKSSKEDHVKQQDIENGGTSHTKIAEINEPLKIKTEINENNLIGPSVYEEEN